MATYNNTNAREEQDLTALLLKALGVFDSQRLSELSGEAIAAVAAGSVFFHPFRRAGGFFYEVHYTNGYGMVIRKDFGSYGGEDDLWEVAVHRLDGDGKWQICYDTSITNDVLGFQTEDDVVDVSRRIRALV